MHGLNSKKIDDWPESVTTVCIQCLVWMVDAEKTVSLRLKMFCRMTSRLNVLYCWYVMWLPLSETGIWPTPPQLVRDPSVHVSRGEPLGSCVFKFRLLLRVKCWNVCYILVHHFCLLLLQVCIHAVLWHLRVCNRRWRGSRCWHVDVGRWGGLCDSPKKLCEPHTDRILISVWRAQTPALAFSWK